MKGQGHFMEATECLHPACAPYGPAHTLQITVTAARNSHHRDRISPQPQHELEVCTKYLFHTRGSTLRNTVYVTGSTLGLKV